MNNTRRKFMINAGIGSLALTVPFLKGNSFFNQMNMNFGIQLWTVKEELAKDTVGTLKKLASFGYKQIESFEGGKGMFWGMPPKEFKKLMDDLGMKIISSHVDNTKDFEKKAAEASSIGMEYLICGWKGPQKSIDDYKKFANEFNSSGEICKKNNLRFAYHNHDYSFKTLDGQIPQDVMMQNTDPNLVDFQMDIYWVVYAGVNPIDYFNKFPNRFKLAHVKDFKKFANPVVPKIPPNLTPEQIKALPEPQLGESCTLGQGSIDFKSVLAAGRKKGLKYTIVEQEAFTGTTILDAVKADAMYMMNL